jgi:tRNA U34 5-methylaminomethyl-2-thiouridine-forming methyltransferase MnmC
MHQNDLVIIPTADGSHTLFVPSLNEHYHSVHGAIQESMHIFINYGLNYFQNQGQPITVFEVGFGTGLNALLTAIDAMRNRRKVDYITTEPFSVPEDTISRLNYTDSAEFQEFAGVFNEIHKAEWDHGPVQIHEWFRIEKLKIAFTKVVDYPECVDVIYFDAFGPDVAPEMWVTDAFVQMHRLLRPGGVLVTYCAKGVVKRALKTAGFEVEPLPGPPGKREVTRALKKSQLESGSGVNKRDF